MALYGLNQDQMNCWVDKFEQYKVNLVLESHSHTTKWSWPCSRNANNDAFEVDTLNGITYIGEGQWGAPHRELDYTGSNQKSWIRDQGVFDSFFFIRTSKDTIQINGVSFENISAIVSTNDDQLGSFLPQGTTKWNPSNGNTIYITKPTNNILELNNTTTKLFPNPTKDKIYISFNNRIDNTTLEVYNSLGKLCIQQKINDVSSFELNIENLCNGVNYILIKDNKGNIESHKIIKTQ